jgi:hypothetical protein
VTSDTDVLSPVGRAVDQTCAIMPIYQQLAGWFGRQPEWAPSA